MRGIEFNRIGQRADVVPPLQGGGKCFGDTDTQGFTLGYNIAGFQPSAITALKGRNATARAEGPGTPSSHCSKPCKGGTLDAESAEVLGNIRELL